MEEAGGSGHIMATRRATTVYMAARGLGRRWGNGSQPEEGVGPSRGRGRQGQTCSILGANRPTVLDGGARSRQRRRAGSRVGR